jgi:hypothetical protein
MLVLCLFPRYVCILLRAAVRLAQHVGDATYRGPLPKISADREIVFAHFASDRSAQQSWGRAHSPQAGISTITGGRSRTSPSSFGASQNR